MVVWRAIGGRLRLFSSKKGRAADSYDSSKLDVCSPTERAVETPPPPADLAPSANQNHLDPAVEQRIEPQESLSSLDLFGDHQDVDAYSPTERAAGTRPQTAPLALSRDPNQLDDPVWGRIDPERIEPQELRNSLDLFVGLQRAFTLDELQEWLGPGLDAETLASVLIADPRTVALGTQDASTRYFVSTEALFRWYVFVTIRLAQAGQPRLKALQVAQAMTSLRLYDKWTAPPPTAIVFGQNYGFIAPAVTPDEYVFPLAQVLAQLPAHSLREAKSVLRAMTHPLNRDSALRQLLRFWVQAGLGNFNNRVVEVVQSREGLNGGEPQTLEQIGARLGVTRERVRQLEAKFWERLSPYPVKSAHRGFESPFRRHLLQPFVSGLLTEVMRRRGSLVLDSQSEKDRLITFVARCVGLSPIEIHGTTLAVLGIANPNDPAFDKTAPSLDLEDIAKSVDSFTNLPNDDVSVIVHHAKKHILHASTKAHAVYLALKHIGKPAHFSAIAEVYNTLFPDNASTEHNVHAVLTREHEDIVWIGIKGTYALKEWGYDRPSMGLYDAVADIVQSLYQRNGKPVSSGVIKAELGKYRKVLNPVSVQFVIYSNPRVRRVSADGFVPRDPDELDESELSAAELDQILREFEQARAERLVEQENG